ncbi:hypothetical protein [Micromonospora sp. KLBMP9576]|uniref:hypothetical protein n=1 Tax=Micromonospora sp. KLBMP9576 TaxID=3424769 RepID=UPI003D89BE1C
MSRSVLYARRAAAAVALGVLAVGCQEAAQEQAARTAATQPSPAPPANATLAPVAATAANTVEVCRQADQVILAAGRKIATHPVAVPRDRAGDQAADQLRRDLAELADDVRAQARRAADPQIRALIEETADRIAAGSRAPRPAAWVDSTFSTIPPELTRHCRA